MNVGPDHTFGILVKPDEYGVGDLLHGRVRGTYLRGKVSIPCLWFIFFER